MAMEMSSSQREKVHDQRSVMSADLFLAAIKGDEDALIQRLRMPKEGNEVMVTIEASHSASDKIKTEHQTVQSELQSATHFGDTVLHLLVTGRHNELALKVFQRDMSLLMEQNKKLETPLHCAVKVGNKEVIQNFIRTDHAVVKDALQKTNENGDTALHVAVKHLHRDLIPELMKLDREATYKVNNDSLSPFHIAIVEQYIYMADNMLEVDPTLGCTQFSDGMFPVHVAAQKGHWLLVLHFMEKYPHHAMLLDPRGRNLFHIAAEKNHEKKIWNAFKWEQSTSDGHRTEFGPMPTPYRPISSGCVRAASIFVRNASISVWIKCARKLKLIGRYGVGIGPNSVRCPSDALYSPFNDRNIREIIEGMINEMDYERNTPEHIALMKGHKSVVNAIRNIRGLPPLLYIEDTDETKKLEENRWDRSQVIGLGSVLITTVTFAAAFTIPGGYKDNGTPVLGRRYMFWAFILANAMSFIQGCLSLLALLLNAMPGVPVATSFQFAVIFFMLAGSSMVVAFGLGMYVTLAPVCLPIATLLLVITLFIGSPALYFVFISRERYIRMVTNLFYSRRAIVPSYMVLVVLIFSLAALLYL